MSRADLKRNSDGTITVIYEQGKKKEVYSFKDEPWYTDADRFQQAYWGFVGLGVSIKPEAFGIKNRRKRT